MCVYIVTIITISVNARLCLVYATMRNLDKKQRLLETVRGLHKDTMVILQMDVTDQQSVLDAMRKVEEDRVDILGKKRIQKEKHQNGDTLKVQQTLE